MIVFSFYSFLTCIGGSNILALACNNTDIKLAAQRRIGEVYE